MFPRIASVIGVPAIILVLLVSPLSAIDAGKDFSGKWILDRQNSDPTSLPVAPDGTLTVFQNDAVIRCSTQTADGRTAQWTYLLNGSESKYKIGPETRNSVVKWEGAALLINTLVSGPSDYVIMDRWRLNRDFTVLTITRQVEQKGQQTEVVLRYRREGTAPAPNPPPPPPAESARTTPPPEEPVLAKRPPAPPDDIIVRAGTRLPLVLLNTIDTKHAHEGDRVYFQTNYPIAVNNRVVIPKGSNVTGVVTDAKAAGKVQGKGELHIRFDSLTLPNGVTKDFRSRLGSADPGAGQVDPNEGKITGERDKGDEVRRGATGAAGGAIGGVILGGAAGHPGMGAGIGGLAGGLAGVLTSKKPDAMLHKGMSVEMILDRDLQFQRDELRF